MEELKRMQQHAKKTNDMRAQEIYAEKAALASELEKLQTRVSIFLNVEDEFIDVLDKMHNSLGVRLSLAKMKKVAAEKEKLEKEMALAYQKREMEKLVEESKKLEQQANENLKFLLDDVESRERCLVWLLHDCFYLSIWTLERFCDPEFHNARI